MRNAAGEVVYHDSVPFLPQNNSTMLSLGIVKVPDGLPQQLGLQGFFYPTAAPLQSGAFTSVYPALVNPLLTLNVFAGDLGIDDGTPRSVYVLDPTKMTQLTGGKTGVKPIELAPGETTELPNGMGTVTFDNESPKNAKDDSQSVKRYVSLQIHHDPSEQWVLAFAALAVLGLVLALFIPRRRMWVKATVVAGAVHLEYAGLARGEDPTLAAAVDDLVAGHARLLDADGSTAAAPDAPPVPVPSPSPSTVPAPVPAPVPEPVPAPVPEPVEGTAAEGASTSSATGNDEPDDSGRSATLGD